MSDSYIIKPLQKELNEASKISFYHQEPRKCIICGSIFEHGRNTICGCCKIHFTCHKCKKNNETIINYKHIQIKYIKKIIELSKNNTINNFNKLCSRACSAKSQLDKLNHIKWCNNCNKETMHAGDMCTICNMNKMKHITWCNKCNKDTKHSGTMCLICHVNKLNVPIKCNIHGHQKYSIGGSCILCHNEELNNKSKNIFETSIICEKHGKQFNSILIKNKNCCIECEKDKYKNSNIFINEVENKLKIKGEIFHTLRTDKDIWENKFLFEDLLIKNDINWFVFAKITINNIIAVIGKTGSKNVIIKSDIFFDNSNLTGKILLKANLKYNKDIIIIWNNKNWNEKDVLNWETKIGDCLLNKFGILNSNSHRQ